jgi:hypothetical protein
MAQNRNRALEITPLSGVHAPIGVSLTHLSPASSPLEPPKAQAAGPAFNCNTLRNLGANSNKLREIAILTEILRPPLALRRTRRMR